jgi:DNA-binding CsgD family transcriptional regulator
MFEAMGMDAFAERTRRELRATGETTQRRTVAVRHTELTIQEAQIARLARDGLTNPEIGTRLLISPHTIQYHLRKVFAKLGISSRSQLDRATLEFPTTGP